MKFFFASIFASILISGAVSYLMISLMQTTQYSGGKVMSSTSSSTVDKAENTKVINSTDSNVEVSQEELNKISKIIKEYEVLDNKLNTLLVESSKYESIDTIPEGLQAEIKSLQEEIDALVESI